MRRGILWRTALAAAAGGACAIGATPAPAQKFLSDSSAFIKAVRDRDGTKAQELLDKPGTNIVLSRDGTTGETALHIAAKRRDITWLQVMLGRGAPVDGRDTQGMTALADAAQLGWSEGAQQLVEVGAKVDLADDRGETPLILATQARSLPLVHLLLERGADPHATDSVAGMSALDYAVRDGRMPAVLKALQEARPVVRRAVAGPSINGR